MMTSAVQNFRYLTEEETQQVVNEVDAAGNKWTCYVCLNNQNKNLVSHCGTLHAVHWECAIKCLRLHNLCSVCQVPVSGEEIKSLKERAVEYYEKTIRAASPTTWVPLIPSIISEYPTATSCAGIFAAWLYTDYSQAYPLLHALGWAFASKYLSAGEPFFSSKIEESELTIINQEKRIKELEAGEEQVKKYLEKSEANLAKCTFQGHIPFLTHLRNKDLKKLNEIKEEQLKVQKLYNKTKKELSGFQSLKSIASGARSVALAYGICSAANAAFSYFS